MKRKLFTKVLATMMLLLGISGSGLAQDKPTKNDAFKVEESFRNSTTKKQNIVFLKDAYLTAGDRPEELENYLNYGGGPFNIYKDRDEEGKGWLRLNYDLLSRNGGIIIDEAFPSDKGVVLDFEYKTWRTNVGDESLEEDLPGYAPRGGDGFSVFLIDGSLEKEDFRLGGFGHNLGYGGDTGYDNAIKGGYLGLGIDEYGNYLFQGTNSYYEQFGKDEEGKYLWGREMEELRYSLQNSIGLRGKSNIQKNTPLMDYTTMKKPGYEIGYPFDPTKLRRPTDDEFYRRVQMELYKYGNGYRVEVRWKRSKDGEFEELFTTDYAEAPYETLKLGFAGSTGDAVNFHEIGGVSVFMPEGVKVDKFIEVVRDGKVVKLKENEVEVGDKLSYLVEVRNLSQFQYENIILNDDLVAISEYFQVEKISFKSELNAEFTKATNFIAGSKSLKEINVNLCRRDAAVFRIEGKVIKSPSKEVFENTATINIEALNFVTAEGNDPHRLTSTVKTYISKPGINLVKTAIVKEDVDTVEGNGVIEYTFEITNAGNVPLKEIRLEDFKIENQTSTTKPFQYKYEGDDNGDELLNVGEKWTTTATYNITDGDLSTGEVINQAVVKGKSSLEKEVEAKSGTEVGNKEPTITIVEGGGPLMTNPHIYHKVQ